MNFQDLLRIAVEASIKAGEAIMEIYNQDFNVQFKDDNSPLTIADKKANDIICSFLEETNLPIISEENAQVAYAERKQWSYCWMVDPLDGTKEFIKRNGEFTVNIALIEKGRPILGIIYVPVERKLYFANVKEEEARWLLLDKKPILYKHILKKSVQLQPSEPSNTIITVVGSRSHMNEDTINYIKQLEQNDSTINIISKGSSLKFCLVAEGKANVYPRYAPTMEWDTAAAQAICQAAGKDVISLETNKSLVYNKENLLNPYFVCK